jgi:hypothetical protein
MFGSAHVAKAIRDTALGLTAVTNVVGQRIERRFYPQTDAGFVTPFLYYLMTEPAIDDGPMGRMVSHQTIRFEIAFVDADSSLAQVMPAAVALDAALQQINNAAVTIAGVTQQITCRREYELPDFEIELGLPMVRLGGLYVFDVG